MPMLGFTAYIMFQMMAPPTIEMAIGMKIIALANFSKRLRSASTATSNPRMTAPVAPNTIHRMLLRNATIIGLFGSSEKTAR